MKEALTLIMLALLIVPLLIGVRRMRRLPREGSRREGDQPGSRSGEEAPRKVPHCGDPDGRGP